MTTYLCACSLFYKATPKLIQGSYYMMGDVNCRSYRFESSTSGVYCYNSDGEVTGYRSAMNNQQLQMYMYNQQMEQAKSSTTCYKNAYSQSVTCY